MNGNQKHTELTETDLKFLKRCLELAQEAFEAGDEPFGSILVSGNGQILAEERNRVNEINILYHPEIELARWAVENLSAEERKNAVMYTSGEHCPMCAAAHGWAGIGGLVYLSSAEQLGEWVAGTGVPEAPIRFYPAGEIIRNVVIKGPADGEMPERIKELQLKSEKRKNENRS